MKIDKPKMFPLTMSQLTQPSEKIVQRNIDSDRGLPPLSPNSHGKNKDRQRASARHKGLCQSSLGLLKRPASTGKPGIDDSTGKNLKNFEEASLELEFGQHIETSSKTLLGNASVKDSNGRIYKISQPPFAKGYHGEVFLAIRGSDSRKFALKVAHKNENYLRHVESMRSEHSLIAPAWKEAGLVPPEFETHLINDGEAILKTFASGKTFGKLIEEGLFFSDNCNARPLFIEMLQTQIKSGKYFGDLSPDNVIFEEGKRCTVIDSNSLIEGLEPKEAALLYRGESTGKYDGQFHPNRYSLNANDRESGKWGKYIELNLSGLDKESREKIRSNIRMMIDQATSRFLDI